jgi:hypothetical protein
MIRRDCRHELASFDGRDADHLAVALLTVVAGGSMAERSERPRPHGDPLEREVTEDNRAQRQSDAPGDASPGGDRGDVVGHTDRSGGRGSTANGIPAGDEDDGAQRRKRYDEGADLVSRMD